MSTCKSFISFILQRTLEPRLFYLYIPNENQSDLPIFDTGQFDFSFEQLFRENRFSGHDRLGDANQVNLLEAGYNIGRDTVLGSLRNANLQLRSEPANPQANVGPWNNTTIGPDANRRPLEIGCGPF